VTVPAGAPVSALAPGEDGPVWHTLRADQVLQAEVVDGQHGLTSAEAASRAERFGLNKFDAGKAEPRWRAFLRQYTDLMQLVLLVAGLVSLVLQEWETGIVLIALTLFNAVLGLQQEGKAAAAVTALQKMMIIKARVLFFSIETRDERRTAFSLDTFSDSKFVIATGVSILTLLLTTVFGPLQAFLKTTSLDVRQWLICLAVALSIVVVSEVRKAVRRHTVPSHPTTR
jgi:magnesium-transporting ATPase (P-type)